MLTWPLAEGVKKLAASLQKVSVEEGWPGDKTMSTESSVEACIYCLRETVVRTGES